ncbi:hypothetical protein [Sphingobacterium griseoflavum]|uniref:Lipoprotein n=1 Tax=Sphingobacterium griseoflavum TaxID=1474952 RepID=A0ABQ3HUX5_9SPHI|nr:hypothetical protein [Sphingobacterium griseoflavum]GHE37130.1 hypothetical protein GCM10017764_20440 [Sphingobacterium griseoflavum]
MQKKFILIIIILTVFIGACQRQEIVSEAGNDLRKTASGLGEKLENPYSLPNMKRAIQLLMSVAPDADFPSVSDLSPTHLYVRFLPADYEEMQVLEQDSTLLYDPVPFGYENSMDLDYYHDPEIPEDKITWLYAFVPHDYSFPDVQYEVLEEIYMPEDGEDELETLAMKMTDNLENEVVNGHQLMSSNLNDRELLGLFSRRFNPSGTIMVQNSFGGSVPLRRAAIYIKTLWWNDVSQTNDNGYYFVNRRYKHTPSVKIWNRNSTNYTTQRWTEHAGFLVSDKLGEGKVFNYTIEHTTGSKRDLWVKATINNAYVIYDDFTRANQIARPDGLRTWVFKSSNYGGAPLLHNRTLRSYSVHYPGIASRNGENFGSLVGKTGIFSLSPIMDLITRATISHGNLPDIVIGTSGKNTSEIYAMVFHEAAHYSHKAKVSNAYWANVQYQAMFDKTNGTYGDGSPAYATYTGVAEAWSYFIEYQLMYQTFPSSTSATIPNIRDGRYNRNMTAYYGDPSTIPGSASDAASFARWIPSGLFRDLMDSDNNALQLRSGTSYSSIVDSGTDRVSGFTYKQLYDLLTPDVTSMTVLRQKIVAQYPPKNTANQVTELFRLYGY